MKRTIDNAINILAVIPEARALAPTLEHLREMNPHHRPIGTTDPFEALALLMSRDFDVLVCAFDIPRLNGERLVREIAGDLRAPATIFLAPQGRIGAEQAAIALGVRHILATPVNPHALRLAVADAVKHTHRVRALGSGLHAIKPANDPTISVREVKTHLRRLVVDLKPLVSQQGASPGSLAVVRTAPESPTLQTLRKSSIEGGRPFLVFRQIMRHAIESWLANSTLENVLTIPVAGPELFAPDLITATSLPWALRRSIVFTFTIDSTDLRVLRQANALQQAGYRVAVDGEVLNPSLLVHMQPNFSLAGNRLDIHQSTYLLLNSKLQRRS